MEFLDILDKNGNKTGEIISREEAHCKGYWHRSIVVFIINSKKKLLIQKRSANKKKHPNLWDFSCGGHISAGETSLIGAIREIEEELGIHVNQKNMYLIDTLIKSYKPRADYFENEFQDIYLCFENIDIQDIVIQKEEVSDAKFIDFKEYKKMILTENENFVNRKKTYKELLEKIEILINKGVSNYIKL